MWFSHLMNADFFSFVSLLYVGLGIPAGFLVLLWMEHRKEHPKWRVVLILLAVLSGFICIACNLLGTVHALNPYKEINQERSFFWNSFATRLHATDSLPAAIETVERMDKGDTIQCIGFILLKFEVYSCIGFVVCCFFFAAYVVLLFFRKKIPSTVLVLLIVFSLTGLGVGMKQRSFAKQLKYRLNNFLSQQMEILAELRTAPCARSNSEIADIVQTYLKETPRVFREPQSRLLDEIQEKKQP